MNKKKLLIYGGFLFLIFCYILVTAGAYFFIEQLMFPAPPSSYTDTAEIIKLTTTNGTRISAKYYQNPTAEYTVLYSHGNGEDIGRSEPHTDFIFDAGYSVFIYDYAGYGTSEGMASTSQTLQDIDAAYSYLVNDLNISTSKIIVYGRSIGGGPSTYLATSQPVAGLILESTFTSVYQIATRYPVLLFDRYPNLKLLQKVKTPVLIIHGSTDDRISYLHAQALFNAANKPKRLVTIKDAKHNNLLETDPQSYKEALVFFRQMLQSE